jgi:CRISPR system Cascade subunit CasE
MMHLSVLLVNTGDQNCDRPRPGRLWLRNIYHVHQRLSMAFPSRENVQTDPLFLQPYNDKAFLRPKFLFRIERGVRGDQTRTVILVQSELAPNWDYAFQNAPGLVECWQTRPLDWNVATGQRFRFRLLANPTKKQQVEGSKSRGVALIGEELQKAWLSREGQKHGFSLVEVTFERAGFKQGVKHDYKLSETAVERKLKLAAVKFEGVLEVTDAQKFAQALRSGVGSGKAFGCGLLSVLPVT